MATVEGSQVIDDLDIQALVGSKAAYDVVLPVRVSDGVCTIVFSSEAKLSGLRLESVLGGSG